MNRLNRRSVIVIAMALLMLVSMIIISYEAIVTTIGAIRDHTLLNFGRICVGKQTHGRGFLGASPDDLSGERRSCARVHKFLQQCD